MKYVPLLCILATPTFAQETDLQTYIASLNYTAVSISGKAGFIGDRDREYIFRDENGHFFEMKMDSGRQDREEIKTKCKVNSFMVSSGKLCDFKARGTVEIEGSRILLSIEEVLALGE